VNKKTACAALVTACILVLASIPAASAGEPEYQVDSVDLVVYRDGLVRITQALTVNETFPAITVRLLASTVDNVIVVDENGTLLDYEIEEYNMTIFSLGARRIVMEYDTVMLTQKEAGVWTLSLNTPYNLTIRFPEGSTVIYLSDVPLAISTEDDTTVLQLFPGPWQISYMPPIIPPPGTAIITGKVTDAKTGLPVAGANVATNSYQTSTGSDGSYSLNVMVGSYEITVTMTGYEAKTTSVDASEEKTYVAEVAMNPAPPSLIPFPPEYLAVVIIIAALGVLILLRRRGPPKANSLLKKHPDLRTEDREVIQFIAEKGGKVLEAELREKFSGLPRTTLWRLVKRLERMDIVTVKKIGLQNQIELTK